MPRLDPFGDFRPDVRGPMRWLLLYRFVSNVGVRFAYSFLPALARGTGLSVSELGTVLALRDLSGLAAPGVGKLSQRVGTIRLMAFGSIVATASALVAGIGPIGLVVGLVAFGIGKIVFDVGMNTWVGDEVSYDRRARASGLVEMAWAAAAVIGLPLCGLAIDRFGWRAAPLLVGFAGLAPTIAINRFRGSAHAHEASVDVKLVLGPNGIGALVGFCAMTGASQLLIVGHGLWLEDTYGLDPSEVGLAVISIGLIEAAASLATALFTDRVGKRVAVLAGAGVLSLACVALAAVPAPPLALGLLLLAVAFLGFEFAFVSALPLLAELDPVSRAKMLGLSLGLSTVVRAAGSPLGIRVYDSGGFDLLMLFGTGFAALTIATFVFFVTEPDGGVGAETA